ncbi:MAG TPA: S1 RNA-binding domain-containing protein [Anaerolineae bacterium]|nr:S1 RNA-binding domain-containing protein [Anaerolineae bacterium]
MTNENLTQQTDASHPMDFLLAGDFNLGIPVAGDIIIGTVVENRQNAILVDINAKSEGIIYGRELDNLDEDTRADLTEGTEVPVFVVNPEDRDGNIVLSYTRAAEEKDWEMAQALLDSQDVYEGKVIGHNRGGLLVKVGYLRGFIPTSQLSNMRRLQKDNNEAFLKDIVGEKITAKVIEVDRRRNRLIISERAAAREVRAAQRERLMDELQEGEVRTGRVVNIADFGAFVDIGGLEGLVHLSELSWKRITKPTDLVAIGDEVEVYVLNIDQDRQRVALSMKRLENDPWSIINDTYTVGQLVEVTITKLTNYGAFASLGDEYGLEGLIHISELSAQHVKHPREVVKKGDTVVTRIIRVDPKQRQIGLSIKQVSSDKFMDVDLALANMEEE